MSLSEMPEADVLLGVLLVAPALFQGHKNNAVPLVGADQVPGTIVLHSCSPSLTVRVLLSPL